ncbi:hypothetical protein ACK8P5_00685 [Paenibacillus sp. EC2-1]|uniref:hypothetical protein n=1 Tax=Paenibacillus sp. EC2-1 TaxID=3388665 RepID=UPI003BEEBD20
MAPNIYEEDELKVIEAYKKRGHTITEEQAGDIWSEYSNDEFLASWMMMGDDLDVIYDQTIKYAKSLGIVTEDDKHGT